MTPCPAAILMIPGRWDLPRAIVLTGSASRICLRSTTSSADGTKRETPRRIGAGNCRNWRTGFTPGTDSGSHPGLILTSSVFRTHEDQQVRRVEAPAHELAHPHAVRDGEQLITDRYYNLLGLVGGGVTVGRRTVHFLPHLIRQVQNIQGGTIAQMISPPAGGGDAQSKALYVAHIMRLRLGEALHGNEVVLGLLRQSFQRAGAIRDQVTQSPPGRHILQQLPDQLRVAPSEITVHVFSGDNAPLRQLQEPAYDPACC